MFKFHELHREICLTCHYYDIPRRMVVGGRQVFIDYDATTGGCTLFNNFSAGLHLRALQGAFLPLPSVA